MSLKKGQKIVRLTQEEIDFINTFDDEITCKEIRKKFIERFCRDVSIPTINAKRKRIKKLWMPKHGLKSEDLEGIRTNNACENGIFGLEVSAGERLAIGIVKQAYIDAACKARRGKDWSSEREFFKSGFIERLWDVDGQFFINQLEEMQNECKFRKRGKGNAR